MASIKLPDQLSSIKMLALVISDLLEYGLDLIRPGITTLELDCAVENRMDELGVSGPCKGYHGFPSVSCISVNDQVTHGIPDSTLLKEGDIVDLDLVIEKDGFFADISKTVGVGDIAPESRRLITITEECLTRGISAVKPGNHLGDIGYAIQTHAERSGYTVVKDYCGHFIGTSMHEEPLVLNYGKKGKGLKLMPGMVFCIEPMINQGTHAVITRGWDARTADGKLSSRCEHMVAVTKNGCEVLTRHPHR